MMVEGTSKDAPFAELLNPEGRSCSLRVEDGPERLIVRPRGYPFWFIILCLALPVGAGTAYLAHRAVHQALGALEVLAVASGYLAAGFIIAGFRSADRSMAARDPFCILDKGDRVLHLPRAGLQLRASEIDGFVEVRAWHTGKAGMYRLETWLGELSVLVRTRQGEAARYSVACCMNTYRLHRLTQALAEFFGVPVRLIRVDRKFLVRLRAESLSHKGGQEASR